MAGQFDQVEALVSLASSLDTQKLDTVYDAIAQRISGAGAKDIAEAVTEIQSIGADPDKYIAVPRSYMRQQRELQKQRHEDERHEVEMRTKRAAAELAELTVANARSKVTA